MRLEAVIGSTADTWVRMQAAYDLAQVCNSANNPARGFKTVYAFNFQARATEAGVI